MSTKINHSTVVPYSAEQMFALVNDIASYEQFVPYCEKSTVHTVLADCIEATLQLGLAVPVPLLGVKTIKQSFRTKNILQVPVRMDMQLVSGPLKKLVGHWRFVSLEADQCEVSLVLEIAFSNPIIEKLFVKYSHKVAEKLVQAFLQRAIAIYGEKND